MMQGVFCDLWLIIILLGVMESYCTPGRKADDFGKYSISRLNITKGCENSKEMNKCLAQFLPKVRFGIPSTKQETDTACSVFNSSMNCIQQHLQKCNKDPQSRAEFNASVQPQIDMYADLCNDKELSTTIEKSGECFRKVSPGYGKCSEWYSQVRGGLSYERHAFQICCHQINFLTCVSRVAKNFCTPVAYSTMLTLAKQAVQLDRTDKKLRVDKMQCLVENFNKCPEYTESNGNFIKGSSQIQRIVILILSFKSFN